MNNTNGFPTDEDWSGLNDKRRIPAFPLRLTELEVRKLKYLADANGTSMHQLCVDALRGLLGDIAETPGETNTNPRQDKNHKLVCPHCKGTLFEIAI